MIKRSSPGRAVILVLASAAVEKHGILEGAFRDPARAPGGFHVRLTSRDSSGGSGRGIVMVKHPLLVITCKQDPLRRAKVTRDHCACHEVNMEKRESSM